MQSPVSNCVSVTRATGATLVLILISFFTETGGSGCGMSGVTLPPSVVHEMIADSIMPAAALVVSLILCYHDMVMNVFYLRVLPRTCKSQTDAVSMRRIEMMPAYVYVCKDRFYFSFLQALAGTYYKKNTQFPVIFIAGHSHAVFGRHLASACKNMHNIRIPQVHNGSYNQVSL